MNGQDAFRRLANQLKTAGGGGGPLPGAPKGLFAGSGLLIALVAGGFALNASLFNGAYFSFAILIESHIWIDSRWWSSCYQIYSVRVLVHVEGLCLTKLLGFMASKRKFTTKELTWL